jgi:hypothetical protein
MKLNLTVGGLFAVSLFTHSFAQTNPASVTPATPPASTNAVIAPATSTQTDPFSDPLIKEVQARHEKAVNGDTKETKKLTADLEKWTQEQPTNYLLQAYLGSVYTLDSRDAWIGPGKLTFLKKGGQNLDGAVASDPNNPAVRFVRAIDYFELPAIFGKRQTARDDFQMLVKQVEGTIKTPYVLNLETQQAIYYYAGLSYQQLSQPDQAKDVWQRGLKLDAKSALGVKIKAALKDLE